MLLTGMQFTRHRTYVEWGKQKKSWSCSNQPSE